MPEKQADKYLLAVMGVAAFLAAFAKSLSEERVKEIFSRDGFINLLIQTFIGTICGMFFGFISCLIFGESVYAVGAFSGGGAILGINGVRVVAESLAQKLIKK